MEEYQNEDYVVYPLIFWRRDGLGSVFIDQRWAIARAVVAEWLRRQTRNLLGSARTGSNPVDCDIFWCWSVKCILHVTPSEVALEFWKALKYGEPDSRSRFLHFRHLQNSKEIASYFLIGSSVWNSIGFLSNLTILKQLQKVLKLMEEKAIREEKLMDGGLDSSWWRIKVMEDEISFFAPSIWSSHQFHPPSIWSSHQPGPPSQQKSPLNKIPSLNFLSPTEFPPSIEENNKKLSGSCCTLKALGNYVSNLAHTYF